ncbi:MAG: type VI secretion system tip protein TssI/VgrG [Polyangiales bacterium]
MSQALSKTFVKTPLPREALLLRRMEADEGLSRLFELRLDLLAKDVLAPAAVLGETMSVQLECDDGKLRYFHGYVTELATLPGGRGRALHYRAVLRPFLWFLSRSRDCRIFQRKTASEIVRQVLRERGFSDVKVRLSAPEQRFEYRVQYRETDLDFVSRLLEQEGIYYYFEHEATKHTLVLADGPASHDPAPGYETVKYASHTHDAGRQHDRLDGWEVARRLETGAYVLDDYDFERPTAALRARLSPPGDPVMRKLEMYDYPGGYLTTDVGERYARVRLEEQHAGRERFHATGTVRGLGAGATFRLAECPRAAENGSYLVIEARYRLELQGADATPESDPSIAPFRSALTLLKSDVPYRPARRTERPCIAGVQTAKVVGKGSGTDIWTDKHGRVKVQFPWDREGKSDENSSCWLRVAQVWAGSGWGTQHVPRIGQEVLVSFLEGDPDRPIVTGSVYNGSATPPFALPDKAMVSGVKTDSTPNAVGYNELSFDDTKGKENIVLRAQRDLTAEVGRDASFTVTRDVTTQVDRDVTVSVGRDLAESIARSLKIDAGERVHVTAGLELRLTVGTTEIVLSPAGIELRGLIVADPRAALGLKAAIMKI